MGGGGLVFAQVLVGALHGKRLGPPFTIGKRVAVEAPDVCSEEKKKVRTRECSLGATSKSRIFKRLNG